MYAPRRLLESGTDCSKSSELVSACNHAIFCVRVPALQCGTDQSRQCHPSLGLRWIILTDYVDRYIWERLLQKDATVASY
jgi:hypothetical protein